MGGEGYGFVLVWLCELYLFVFYFWFEVGVVLGVDMVFDFYCMCLKLVVCDVGVFVVFEIFVLIWCG